MATFNVEPVQRFAHLNAAIRRPKEITCFSFDEDHNFRLDGSSLRYYYPPNLSGGIDLSQGFESFRKLDDSKDEHLDGLLDAIAAHEQQTGCKLETDIITWRGMMTKIMTVPYSNLDEWEMNATLFEGTIFIEENHQKKMSSRLQQQQQQQQQQRNQPNRGGGGSFNFSQDMMSFWGYKFETLCLLPAPWSETSREYIERREGQVVSNYAQYCSIVRTGFGKTKIVIGGEVDAVMAYKPGPDEVAAGKTTPPTDWVELKTSAELTNDREHAKFARKLLKFWAQSFLLGVPRIIVGFRSQQGILRRLEEFDTQAIPERVQRQYQNQNHHLHLHQPQQQQQQQLWDGQICINFASSFLEWLRATISTPGVWRIQKQAKKPVIQVWKIQDSGTGGILSQNFLAWRESAAASASASARQKDSNESSSHSRTVAISATIESSAVDNTVMVGPPT